MTSLVSFSFFFFFFHPNVTAPGTKYYWNVVKTSCEIMREKINTTEKGGRWWRKFQIWNLPLNDRTSFHWQPWNSSSVLLLLRFLKRLPGHLGYLLLLFSSVFFLVGSICDVFAPVKWTFPLKRTIHRAWIFPPLNRCERSEFFFHPMDGGYFSFVCCLFSYYFEPVNDFSKSWGMRL